MSEQVRPASLTFDSSANSIHKYKYTYKYPFGLSSNFASFPSGKHRVSRWAPGAFYFFVDVAPTDPISQADRQQREQTNDESANVRMGIPPVH